MSRRHDQYAEHLRRRRQAQQAEPMEAPESFVEMVRCQLVLPRRNVQRALNRMREIPVPTPRADYNNALYFLEQANEQIAALEAFANQAADRAYHTCSCGHVHYIHGEDA